MKVFFFFFFRPNSPFRPTLNQLREDGNSLNGHLELIKSSKISQKLTLDSLCEIRTGILESRYQPTLAQLDHIHVIRPSNAKAEIAERTITNTNKSEEIIAPKHFLQRDDLLVTFHNKYAFYEFNKLLEAIPSTITAVASHYFYVISPVEAKLNHYGVHPEYLNLIIRLKLATLAQGGTQPKLNEIKKLDLELHETPTQEFIAETMNHLDSITTESNQYKSLIIDAIRGDEVLKIEQ